MPSFLQDPFDKNTNSIVTETTNRNKKETSRGTEGERSSGKIYNTRELRK
jgi:hypothetical protein